MDGLSSTKAMYGRYQNTQLTLPWIMDQYLKLMIRLGIPYLRDNHWCTKVQSHVCRHWSCDIGSLVPERDKAWERGYDISSGYCIFY